MTLSSWLLYLCMAVMYAASSLAHGQCHESQRSLLLLLKHDFNTTHWGNKIKSWDPTQDCCGWTGVTCTNGYVTGLDLSVEGIEAGLNGSSPLFELRNLTTLNLAVNLFSTTIPPSFAKLGNLVHLNLSAADFEGQIPIEISTLTRLETLDTGSNLGIKLYNPNLSTLVGNMPNLVKLRLSYVDLSTQSSDWCQVLSSSAPHLQLLDLSNTGLSGPIHPSLGKLKSLSTIDLSRNSFSEPSPSLFSNFRNLTYLNLAESVSGKFPLSILQLPALRYLDLSENSYLEPGNFPSTIRNSSLETLILKSTPFSKNIPDSIGQLRMLSRLDISECHLSGEIPKSFFQLTRLVSVGVSFNSLTGLIPTFSLARSLRELDLSYNLLQGSLLSTDWKQLSHLEVIRLSGNSLSGTIPTSLFGIPTLQQALLSENRFTGFTKDVPITPSSQLHVLDINLNDLQGEFPSFIFGLQGLRELDLSNNNFGDTLHLNSLRRLKDLTSLYLSHSNLVVEMGPAGTPSFPLLGTLELASCGMKSIPIFLKNHSAIEEVDLSDNQITGQVPSWIWDIDTLTSLNLSHNHLESVETTNATHSLRYVSLSFNRLHGHLPSYFSTDVLEASNNQFNSTISSVVRNFNDAFAFLDISRSNLYGSIPESICNMSFLYYLDLSDNFLSGAIPECLLNIQHLNLKGNNLSGILPDTLPSPCSLQTMDISGNSLHGSIPKWLGNNCAELEVLDLSYNKFEEKIPYELGYPQRFNAINVSHNELTGPIPTSFGNLTRLESLDLADNKLSGSIPKQLASLTSLSYFNVSNNELVGRIPKGGSQFQKFTQASFEGNKGLCGYPLTKKC